MMTWLKHYVQGLVAMPKGVVLLLRQPSLLCWLAVPAVVAVSTGLTLLMIWWNYRSVLVAGVTPSFGEGWGAPVAAIIGWINAGLVAVLTATVASLGIAQGVCAPIYDYVSARIETISGQNLRQDASFTLSLFLITEELKKTVWLAVIGSAITAVPGLQLLGVPFLCFVAGWNAYDLVLARKGLRLGERLRVMAQRPGRVLGIGTWQLLPLMPLIAFPLGIAGSTLLALEDLKHYDGATRKVTRT